MERENLQVFRPKIQMRHLTWDNRENGKIHSPFNIHDVLFIPNFQVKILLGKKPMTPLKTGRKISDLVQKAF